MVWPHLYGCWNLGAETRLVQKRTILAISHGRINMYIHECFQCTYRHPLRPLKFILHNYTFYDRRSTCFTHTRYSIDHTRAAHCNAVVATLCYSSNVSRIAASTAGLNGTVCCIHKAHNCSVTQTRSWWSPGNCTASIHHTMRSHWRNYRERRMKTGCSSSWKLL